MRQNYVIPSKIMIIKFQRKYSNINHKDKQTCYEFKVQTKLDIQSLKKMHTESILFHTNIPGNCFSNIFTHPGRAFISPMCEVWSSKPTLSVVFLSLTLKAPWSSRYIPRHCWLGLDMTKTVVD